MQKHTYAIKGMHCRSCEILIEKNISKIPGVKKVEVHHKRGIAEVEFTHARVSDELIAHAVNDAGYSLGKADRLPLVTTDGEDYFEILLGLSGLIVLYFFAKITGLTTLFTAQFSGTPAYPIVFAIGLTAGVSTCMAVVGGLVAGFSAAYAESHQYATRWERFRPNIYFNIGRLVSYALLGGAIGAFGSVIKISSATTGLLVFVAGFVMLYMGLKLTGISPKLSNLSLTLPKRLSRKLGLTDASDEYSHKEAFVGGALTFFLPCGFTQAMQLYAITTGSFASGAIIMFLFALGTMPGLLGVGALTSVLKGKTSRMFFRFVGVVVVVLGIVNISNGYTLSGLNISLLPSGAPSGQIATIENGEQIVNMNQLVDGYDPNKFTIKKGVPVRWVIDSKNSYTCASNIRIPALGIVQQLQSGINIIRFTPKTSGTLRFTCSMGMYSGTFNVVD
ncbi:MAG: sulfite exporter TauE/SafE family protein [bacterium]|nr:sulfite exporter TauE/SafE family protein [bacterium]